MCEASAYWLKNGQEELLMSEVDKIEPDGDELRLVSITTAVFFMACLLALIILQTW